MRRKRWASVGGLELEGNGMSRLPVTLLTWATICSLLSSASINAQVHPPAPLKKGELPPPAKRAARVNITYGPALEIAHHDVAIIRWITNNPGGLDDHFSIAEYGTDPKDLSQRAKSQIRLNRAHPETIFRVRLSGLKPRTTYYYRVTSEDSSGTSDGVKSDLNKFTMPGPGERIIFDVKRDGTLQAGPGLGSLLPRR
jgi:Purple acid Phosphatase, N-terminal domain